MLPFDEVYESHAAFVFRAVRGLGVPDGLIEDAVQDVFVIVHRRLPEFDGSGAVKPWLYAIARRIAHDYRRSLKRKGLHEPLPETVRDNTSGPLDEAAHQETLRLLEDILRGLDDDKREVLVLAELEQLSVPEISEMLNLNLNTVYSRLRRARDAFDEALKKRRGSAP